MPKKSSAVKEYWHFLMADKRLQFGEPRKLVRTGSTMRFDGQPVLCHCGLHASAKAIDALKYAPGPIICRVTLGGTIVEDTDKAVAQSRTVLWMADATNVLHEFACWCAEQSLRTAKVDDVRCWQAIETKRKWLNGEATDEELDAARAARDAARAAAWDAARAARDAARAARDAAWDAAWDAARAAQNNRLEEMLLDLQPKRSRAHA